jgi:hypothetical protein
MAILRALKVAGFPEFPNAVHQLVGAEIDLERKEFRARLRVWGSAALRQAGEPPISHMLVSFKANEHPQANVLLGLEDAPLNAPRNRRAAIYQAVMAHPDMAGSRHDESLEGDVSL